MMPKKIFADITDYWNFMWHAVKNAKRQTPNRHRNGAARKKFHAYDLK